MRAHDERTEKTGTPPAKRPRPAGAAPTDRVVALQRTVGNAAVAGLLADREQHPTVHSVLNGSGRPPDEPVRREMEGGPGTDLSDVRPHTGPAAERSAREIGARADTSGNHVSTKGGVAPAAPASGAPATVQRALRLGDTNLTALARQGNVRPAQEVWRQILTLPAYQGRSEVDQNRMMQQFRKWVEDKAGDKQAGANQVWGRKSQDRVYYAVADLEAALHGWVAAKPARREEGEYAGKIIESPEVAVRLDSILYRIRKKVDDLEDSDQASDRARKQPILDQLGQLLHEGMQIGGGKVKDRPLGWYQYHLDFKAEQLDDSDLASGIERGVLHVLDNPEDYTFQQKVVVIHDLMEYFGDQRDWNPTSEGAGLLPPPGSEFSLGTADIIDGDRVTTESRGRLRDRSGTDPKRPKFHQGTRDEREDSTRFARRHGIPVWSGSSNTTVHLLNLARWADATRDEMTALAHSIFAYWRLEYDHTSLAPHTLHEVMDIAQNFGVPYDPLNRYDNLGHENTGQEQQALFADVRTRWNAVMARTAQHRSSPEYQELAREWGQDMKATQNVLSSFGEIAPEKRTEELSNALRVVAGFDLALNGFERWLRTAAEQEA